MSQAKVKASRAGPKDEGFVHVYRSASTPERSIVIEDPAMLRVFYEPLRQRILGALGTPMSVKELADSLDDTANHLYYHVRILEKAGFIEVVDQRIVGSNVERLYGRSASRIELAPELWAEGAMLAQPSVNAVNVEAFETFARWLSVAAGDMPARIREGHVEDLPVPTILWLQRRIAPDRVKAFAEGISALAFEFLGPESPKDPDGVELGGLVVLTPVPDEEVEP